MRHAGRWAAAAVVIGTVAPAAPAAAQRTLEFGTDAGANFALGSKSSVAINLPGARFRVGFFRSPGSRWSLEPAAALTWNQVEHESGIFNYDIEGGALYHFRPFVIATSGGTQGSEVVARISSAYVRPFVAVTGFSGGGAGHSEFSTGAGLGLKVPWRRDLAWRVEGNVGYNFDAKATRIGLLGGISYFSRSGPR
jgi:hypothetical protein